MLIKRPRRSTRSWKPQVFQERLQSSAKTAGSYTSGAFKAGSLFILTNFLWLNMCFQTCGQLVVIEWKCWGLGPGYHRWASDFQPPWSHDSALLLLHGYNSGGRKTTLTVMKPSNGACVTVQTVTDIKSKHKQILGTTSGLSVQATSP